MSALFNSADTSYLSPLPSRVRSLPPALEGSCRRVSGSSLPLGVSCPCHLYPGHQAPSHGQLAGLSPRLRSPVVFTRRARTRISPRAAWSGLVFSESEAVCLESALRRSQALHSASAPSPRRPRLPVSASGPVLLPSCRPPPRARGPPVTSPRLASFLSVVSAVTPFSFLVRFAPHRPPPQQLQGPAR